MFYIIFGLNKVMSGEKKINGCIKLSIRLSNKVIRMSFIMEIFYRF